MTKFNAYGPKNEKINFPTSGLYDGRIYMDQNSSCWEYFENTENDGRWINIDEEGSDWFVEVKNNG